MVGDVFAATMTGFEKSHADSIVRSTVGAPMTHSLIVAKVCMFCLSDASLKPQCANGFFTSLR
jgi:hypothetical protein